MESHQPEHLAAVAGTVSSTHTTTRLPVAHHSEERPREHS